VSEYVGYNTDDPR